MKKISEMNEDELRDYALAKEQENAALLEEKTALIGKNTQLDELNKQLQMRNNALFLQVEQQQTPTEEKPPEQKPVQSCEDFARKLILGE